jgi:hypothetical protein
MPAKERGPLLTGWLVLMLVANAATVFLYSVIANSTLARNMFLPNIQLWVIYVFISLGVLNLVCVSFLFLWKKWAFFVLCGSAGTAFGINVFVGVGAFAFVGLGGVVITYLIIRSKWSLFSNF